MKIWQYLQDNPATPIVNSTGQISIIGLMWKFYNDPNFCMKKEQNEEWERFWQKLISAGLPTAGWIKLEIWEKSATYGEILNIFKKADL
jgi:hypothetical protein